MARIRDVAKLAGVAPSTVSGILNNKIRVSEATRRRVLNAVEELGYRPNQLARGLRVSQTRTIGLIVPAIDTPFYPAIARGVEDVASAHGYGVLLCNSGRDTDKEWLYIRTLSDRRVDGLIIMSAAIDSRQTAELAQEFRGPIVFLNRSVPHAGMDEIWLDYRQAAFEMTRFLITSGHRAIAFISGKGLEVRKLGYRDALRAAGLPVDERLIVPEAGLQYSDGYQAGEHLLSRGVEFTAVFAANDLMAVGCMNALQDRGVRVPEDVSVAGFDDIDLATYIRPKLTTVRQPTYEIGQTAMRILLERVEDRRQQKVRHLMETTLMQRDSTRSLQQIACG